MQRYLPWLALAGCSAVGGAQGPGAQVVDTAEVPSAATNACALGLACNPIPIDTFPTTDARSTTEAPGALVDS